MLRYDLYLTNDIFKDDKTQKEIHFSKLTIDLGYKKLKVTSDVADICSLLDITERKLKTEFAYDGVEHKVGVFYVGEDKKQSMIWNILTIVNLLAVLPLWGLVALAIINIKKKKKQVSTGKATPTRK